jgi:hypothetical protein
MPLIFIVSVAIMLAHAIDYDRASVRVEIPLQDIVHVPTYGDVEKYVSFRQPT